MCQEYSSKILCCSQKFNSLFTNTMFMFTCSHDNCIDRLGIKGQSKGVKNKHVERNMEITMSIKMGEEVDITIDIDGRHVTQISMTTCEN